MPAHAMIGGMHRNNLLHGNSEMMGMARSIISVAIGALFLIAVTIALIADVLSSAPRVRRQKPTHRSWNLDVRSSV